MDAALEKIVEKFTAQLTTVISKETQRQIDLALRSVLQQKGGRAAVARAKVDMSCRKPGCKTRSRGPRFGYVCEKHTGWTAEAKKVVAKKAAVRKVARKKAVVKAHTKKVTPPKSPTLSVVKSSAEA